LVKGEPVLRVRLNSAQVVGGLTVADWPERESG
jgi:hypothetical protein